MESNEPSCWPTRPSQCFGQQHQQQQPLDKTNNSRRSVDWRDSGIVIDDEQQYNSIDGIYDPFSTQSAHFSLQFLSGCSGNVNLTDYTCCCPQTSSSSSSTTSSIENNDNKRIASYEQDDDGDTILHLAVVGCTTDKVRDLIKICDLNAINNMMQTPLHVSTMAKRPEMVDILLANGAKLNVHDRKGNTPLHLACQNGHEEIVAIMLDNVLRYTVQGGLTTKQYIEKTNFDGQTCLHLAALHDRRTVIEMLVSKYEADLNCRDSKSGQTVLHKAINKFNVELVAFILNLEKHCNQADYSGRKPLDTIRILRESKIDKCQEDKLIIIDRLVNNRIKSCIDKNGCCSPSFANRKSESFADCPSPANSDYSDSDSDDMSS